MKKGRVLAERIAGFFFNQFFGFTWLDAFYILGLSATGSYFAIDVPANIAVFILCLHSFNSTSKRANKIAVFFLLAGLFSLAGSVALYGFFPKLSPANLSIRMFHQVLSRFYFIVFLAYIVIHLRSQWTDQSAVYRVTTRVGWLFLKISLWAAIFMSFLSIKGQLIPYHVFFLILATPFLIVHIAVAVRRIRRDPARLAAVRPLALTAVLTPRLGISAAVVGFLLAAGLSLGVEAKYSRAFYGSDDYFIKAPQASFAPSPLRAAPNVFFRNRFLGDSAACGNFDCHPNVYYDWVDSPHRFSVTDFYQQEVEAAAKRCGKQEALLCLGCHDPLSLLAGAGQVEARLTVPDGKREGISCLVCHALFATDAAPANAALEFRFPKYYFQQDLSSLSFFLALIEEHKIDFNAPGYRDDRLCIACHRVQEMPGGDRRPINEWLGKPYHQQAKMTPACRGDQGCLDCHMPRVRESEKPGPKLPGHTFGEKMPASEEKAGAATATHPSGGKP